MLRLWPVVLLLAAVVPVTDDAAPLRKPPAPPEGAAGQWLEVQCGLLTGCGEVLLRAPAGAAGGYRMTLESEVQGGFSVEARELAGVPDNRAYHVEQGRWLLGGYGFEPGGPWEWERTLPIGTAEEWLFEFNLDSGETGGRARFLVTWMDVGDAADLREKLNPKPPEPKRVPAPIAGYQQVDAEGTVPPGGVLDLVAPCPDGRKVLGGGFWTPDPQVRAYRSGPLDGSGWRVAFHNEDDAATTVRVQAVCGKAVG